MWLIKDIPQLVAERLALAAHMLALDDSELSRASAQGMLKIL